MANRDLNFTPTVNNVVPAIADSQTNPLVDGVAQLGATLGEQSSQAKLLEQSAQAQVAFKTLDMKFRQQYADDPTNADGLRALQENRQQITDTLGEKIPSLYMRQWQNKTVELAKSSDVSNELWTGKQQRINTVNSVNNSIRTYLDAANKDGMAYAASDDTEISSAMNYMTARGNIEQFGNPVIGSDKTGVLLKSFNTDYVKSFVAGVAENNPAKAASLLNAPEIVEHFTTEERGEMDDLIKKTKKQQELNKSLQVTATETDMTGLVNDPNTSYYEKRAAIDKLDMTGAITPKAASAARRVIKSSSDLDTQTDTPVMADIINQVYDLNANAATNAGDYLDGVRNIQQKIMENQASGSLTAPDANKLNRQLTDLTNKRVSDATQQVGNDFYEANQKFNTLPPEYRGQATRALFYASEGKSFTKQQYANQANIVLDQINSQRRQNALKIATDTEKSDLMFLQSIKASPADVTETAQKHGISEAEVIRMLRAKAASNSRKAVKRAAPQDEENSNEPAAAGADPGIQLSEPPPDEVDNADQQGTTQ